MLKKAFYLKFFIFLFLPLSVYAQVTEKLSDNRIGKIFRIYDNGKNFSDDRICRMALNPKENGWDTTDRSCKYVNEAFKRKLDCISLARNKLKTKNYKSVSNNNNNIELDLSNLLDQKVCDMATSGGSGKWSTSILFYDYVFEAQSRGLTCGVIDDEQKRRKKEAENLKRIAEEKTRKKKEAENLFYCERFYINPQGWRSLKGAESWYPKKILVRLDLTTEKAFLGVGNKYSSNVKIKREGKRFDLKFPIETKGGKYYLKVYFLPNGEVHFQIDPKAGIVDIGGAKYKCNGWPM